MTRARIRAVDRLAAGGLEIEGEDPHKSRGGISVVAFSPFRGVTVVRVVSGEPACRKVERSRCAARRGPTVRKRSRPPAGE